MDTIFEKKLWFLIPFYFFNYKLEEMEENKDEIEQMKITYRDIWCRLDELVEKRIITEYEKGAIKAMCAKVAAALTEKHKNIKEGVDTVMGGQVLEYEAKSIAIRATVESAISFGASKEQALQELQKKYYLSEEKAEEEYDKYAGTVV